MCSNHLGGKWVSDRASDLWCFAQDTSFVDFPTASSTQAFAWESLSVPPFSDSSGMGKSSDHSSSPELRVAYYSSPCVPASSSPPTLLFSSTSACWVESQPHHMREESVETQAGPYWTLILIHSLQFLFFSRLSSSSSTDWWCWG